MTDSNDARENTQPGSDAPKTTRPPWPASGSFSYCESVTASSFAPWHIRELDAQGLKPGGGITTKSLCGRVAPLSQGGVGGWDLRFAVHEKHKNNTCRLCWKEYEDAIAGSASVE